MLKVKNLVLKFGLLTSLIAGVSVGAQAATFTVTNINDAGAGSLRQAITAANNSPEDDVVQFSSLFETAQTIVLKRGLTVANVNKGGLTINGPSLNQLTVSGNKKVLFIFSISKSSAVTINNLVVGEAAGAAFYNTGGRLALNNSTVTNNRTTTWGFGGGVSNWENGAVTISNSTISDSSAFYAGGGVYNNGSTVTLINSTVSRNSSNAGGGIFNIGGTVNLVNSTVAFNRAMQSGGGGIEHNAGGQGGAVNARNSIIAGNTVWYPEVNPSSPDYNQSQGVAGVILNSQGYNLIGNTTKVVIVGDTATNLLNVNPQLDPVLRVNGGVTPTHALLANSPAIDAALAASGILTDQRGMLRPVDVGSKANAAGSDSTDIGAVEQQ